jgi:putative tryptophan/tyrosine transport system substrate-binding protein
VKSLGQPGGNITGLTNMTTQLMAKRLELLKEAVPSVRRVGVLWNPDTPLHKINLANLNAVAPKLHLELVLVPVDRVEELGAAFSTLTRSRVGAVMALDDPFMASNAKAVVQFATKSQLPLALGWRHAAIEGALISYGTQFTDLFRRAAGYVDKILKGASPATLPVEQPSKFELVINLKTARALGLTIHESILLQADEVIK